MKEPEFDIIIGPGGTVEMLYQEGIEEFAAELGATIENIERLTNVEWDEKERGWTVTSACNPFFALRYVTKDGRATFEPRLEIHAHLDLTVFTTREAALEAEKQFATAFMEHRHWYLKTTHREEAREG